MPTFLLSLLGSPKAIGILFIVMALGAATLKYKMMENEIEDQRIEISNITEQKLKAELETAGFKRAAAEVLERTAEVERVAEKVDVIEEKIDASLPEEDGPVADVLRDALADIAGMRVES